MISTSSSSPAAVLNRPDGPAPEIKRPRTPLSPMQQQQQPRRLSMQERQEQWLAKKAAKLAKAQAAAVERETEELTLRPKLIAKRIKKLAAAPGGSGGENNRLERKTSFPAIKSPCNAPSNNGPSTTSTRNTKRRNTWANAAIKLRADDENQKKTTKPRRKSDGGPKLKGAVLKVMDKKKKRKSSKVKIRSAAQQKNEGKLDDQLAQLKMMKQRCEERAAELERAKEDKMRRLIQYCVNKFANGKYVQAWDKWVAVDQERKRALAEEAARIAALPKNVDERLEVSIVGGGYKTKTGVHEGTFAGGFSSFEPDAKYEVILDHNQRKVYIKGKYLEQVSEVAEEEQPEQEEEGPAEEVEVEEEEEEDAKAQMKKLLARVAAKHGPAKTDWSQWRKGGENMRGRGFK